MDPFAVLEVDPRASPAALAEAYRRLAKRWHPDRAGTQAAGGRMAELNVAYDLARSAAHHRRAAPPRAGRRPAAGRGAWLPDAVRRALGPELLRALAAEEHVEATIAAVERRAARLRRGAPAAVRVRATNGQRFTFAELPPATAEGIAGYVPPRRRQAGIAAVRPSPARPVPGRAAAPPPR